MLADLSLGFGAGGAVCVGVASFAVEDPPPTACRNLSTSLLARWLSLC